MIHEPWRRSFSPIPLPSLPVGALVGWRGIASLPHGAVPMVLPRFRAPQVIYAAREMMVACPGTAAPGALAPVAFPPDQARHLALCLMADEVGAAFGARQAAAG